MYNVEFIIGRPARGARGVQRALRWRAASAPA